RRFQTLRPTPQLLSAIVKNPLNGGDLEANGARRSAIFPIGIPERGFSFAPAADEVRNTLASPEIHVVLYHY
ncbi:MAG: hypothetical protein ACJ8CF_01470, partial [Microvirga sp.]